MTTYKTKVASIGDVTVTVSKAGKTAAESCRRSSRRLGDRHRRNGTDQGSRGRSAAVPVAPRPTPDQGLPGGSRTSGPGPAARRRTKPTPCRARSLTEPAAAKSSPTS